MNDGLLNTRFTRRGSLLALGAACAARAAAAEATPLAAIESASGGRLGLCAIDTGNGRRLVHREGERFAFASTFKWLLAARVLQQAEAAPGLLQQSVKIGKADLLPYAPVVQENLKAGRMTVQALCEAIVTVSDNAAANLLLARVGGPAGLTAWLRTLGDKVTRVDRVEPVLNDNLPGDERDTTMPVAMAMLARLLVLGDALKPASRELLIGWMVQSPTGARRLRAALPADWKAADKTGTGARGALNDVAVVWPPGRAPWVVACYLSDSELPRAPLEAVHAQAMAAVRSHFGA